MTHHRGSFIFIRHPLTLHSHCAFLESAGHCVCPSSKNFANRLSIGFAFLARERPSLLCAFFQSTSDFSFQTIVSADFCVQQTRTLSEMAGPLVTLFYFLLIWVMSTGRPFKQSIATIGRFSKSSQYVLNLWFLGDIQKRARAHFLHFFYN